MNEKSEFRSEKSEVGDEGMVRLLCATVGRELDGQRGRAGAAFARAMGDLESVETIENRRSKIENPDMRRLKFWAGAASAMAACLALVVGLQVWLRPGATKQGTCDPAVAAGVPVMDQVEFTRNVDGGTVVVEDAPMRVVRKQTLKRTEWFDRGENARYSVTEPVERVGYVRLQPY